MKYGVIYILDKFNHIDLKHGLRIIMIFQTNRNIIINACIYIYMYIYIYIYIYIEIALRHVGTSVISPTL